MPKVQQQWILHLTEQLETFYENAAYSYLDSIWRENVYPVYMKHIHGKFPFDPNSQDEISFIEFNRFFSSTGILQTYLSLIRPITHTPIFTRLNKSNIYAFNTATRITSNWFEGDKILLDFTLVPLSLDTNAKTFRLDIGNNNIELSEKNMKSYLVSWPGKDNNLVNMEFIDKIGKSTLKSINSNWAFVRLLNSMHVHNLPSHHQYDITFNLQAFKAKYQIISHKFDLLTLGNTKNFTLYKTL